MQGDKPNDKASTDLLAVAAAFRDAAFLYLNVCNNGYVCSDRSCLRCRIADAAFEVERKHGLAPQDYCHIDGEVCPHCNGKPVTINKQLGIVLECCICKGTGKRTSPPNPSCLGAGHLVAGTQHNIVGRSESKEPK